jgi:transcriptional regulator with XRE-family HTH domain
LLALRKREWPDRRITQSTLAEVLGVKVPSISGYESLTDPKPVPEDRLEAYARFFATRRSLEGGQAKLLDDGALTMEEQKRYDSLRDELLELRETSSGRRQAPADTIARPEPSDQPRSFWHFPDGASIVILCGELPQDERPPSADPMSFTYGELYSYADADALIELHGHLRATNPESQVSFRTASNMRADDANNHLVLLGGVAWNNKVARLAARLGLPVYQARGDESEPDIFMTRAGGDARRIFEAVVSPEEELLEDVGMLVRAPNPDNRDRTVTICNGVWSPGVFGAVRALTHDSVRVANETYLRDRFEDDFANFGILMRVAVNPGVIPTPDLRIASNRLFEWPE